jgi:hypothetical protein
MRNDKIYANRQIKNKDHEIIKEKLLLRNVFDYES